MTLVFEPLVSSTLWMTAAFTAVALLGWYAWARPGGLSPFRWRAIITLMATSAGLLLAVLLNPTWQERIPPPPQKPRLAILIDDSASMSSADLPDGRTRYQAAAEIAEACAKQLAEGYDVEVGAFSKALLPANAAELRSRNPAGLVTDLASAISSGIDPGRASGQAILLLSDGNHNAAGGTPRVLASAAVARALAFPYSRKRSAAMPRFTIWRCGRRTRSNFHLSVSRCRFRQSCGRRGRAPGSVTVVLEYDGQEVGRQAAFVAPDSEVEVRFQVQQEKRGLYRYEARVEPFAGEVTQVISNT